MLERIINQIKENNINTWLVSQTTSESLELFFIKKELVTKRVKKVNKYKATIYNDFEIDSIKYRGGVDITFAPGLTDEEISEKIKSAYFAASFVKNPFFEFPEGVKADLIVKESKLFDNSQEENAKIMSAALFESDTNSDSFLNSAELFVNEVLVTIKSSYGTDVSYKKRFVEGEFVTQCKTPQDVETYQDFYYDDLSPSALAKKVKIALDMSKDRAIAKSAPKAGKYRVILSGPYLNTMMEYYMERSTSAMVYPKYSNYQVGDNVQGEDISGDKLNIELIAADPYSSEGIPMINRTLIKDGKLELIHGPSRFAYYLGIEPVGYYESVRLPKGEISFEDMKKEPYLHIVNFSDFQMDSLTGYFGGEIRLGYLFDGEKVTPVTGGSISASVSDIRSDLKFSSDLQVERNFEGPFALSLENVTVAGC